ncbi:MAG: hypothetical protein H6812_13895 [Phycisphaeraceae bacterium]|nr:hypothetical protein [Phycisphaerales bacterium]MCB9844330.1 hypothetical protein [Phycisphaeraceae bacterium]
MTKKKPSSAKKSSKKQINEDPRGFIGWLRGTDDDIELGAAWTNAKRIATGVTLVAILIAWFVALEPLKNRVRQFQSPARLVRIDWPLDDRNQIANWLPASVSEMLMQLAGNELRGSGAFDQESLVRAAYTLESTGWVRSGVEVRRRADGTIDIDGQWRAPAVVIQRNGQHYLGAIAGELLRVPAGLDLERTTMFRVFNPYSEAPKDKMGNPAYGEKWPGGDVQAAITLLDKLGPLDESKFIIGVDAREYMRSGHLLIITDAGGVIDWGSAIGETAPGEVTIEDKISHLRRVLRPGQRLDTQAGRIEIYNRVVQLDKTSR